MLREPLAAFMIVVCSRVASFKKNRSAIDEGIRGYKDVGFMWVTVRCLRSHLTVRVHLMSSVFNQTSTELNIKLQACNSLYSLGIHLRFKATIFTLRSCINNSYYMLLDVPRVKLCVIADNILFCDIHSYICADRELARWSLQPWE